MIKEIQTHLKEKVNAMMQTNMIALVKLLLPFGIAGAVVAFLWIFLPEDFGKYVTVFGVYSFMPLIGTITVVPTGLGLGIPPIPLVAFIIFTDAILALFLVWNFDYAKKIPGFGKLVERVGESGEKALQKYKWAKRFGFIGVVLLVIFPLQWTGAGVGSIVGRLIGMPSLLTWVAVIIGTFIRSTLATLICLGAISLF